MKYSSRKDTESFEEETDRKIGEHWANDEMGE